MKAFLYNSVTGVFNGKTLTGTRESIEKCTPQGVSCYISDSVDMFSMRVDISSGRLIDYQPPQPSDKHEWDGKRWRLNQVTADRIKLVAFAKASIVQLEAAQLRPLRELALDGADAIARDKVTDIDQQIAAQRAIIRANT